MEGIGGLFKGDKSLQTLRISLLLIYTQINTIESFKKHQVIYTIFLEVGHM